MRTIFRADVYAEVSAAGQDVHVWGPAVGDDPRILGHSQAVGVLGDLAEALGRPMVVVTTDEGGQRFRDLFVPSRYEPVEQDRSMLIRPELSGEIAPMRADPAPPALLRVGWTRLLRHRRLVTVSVVAALCLGGATAGMSPPVSGSGSARGPMGDRAAVPPENAGLGLDVPDLLVAELRGRDR